jgi:RNA polymerase sigma factor (sigma-70 family)
MEDASDATLLGWFVARRDQAAFAALVRRHGPMVLGVCRRRLRRREDAEDAFQATFLVLATKAPALKRPGVLGNWLFGVALRAAREAKRSAARRRAGEERLMASLRTKSVRAEDASDPERCEILSALDEEIGRLPEKYRAAVVSCYLQGKGRAEAARQLGWPEGTVATCLTRARDLLRRRLARKGIATSVAALAVTLTPDLTAAPVPQALADSTAEAAALVAAGKPAAVAGLVSEAAAALTKGVSTAMLVTKLKAIALLLLAAVLSLGGIGATVLAAADAAHRKEWRRQFDAVYRLEPGEVVKFIPAPFIPGRGDYIRNAAMHVPAPLATRDVPPSIAMGGSLVLYWTADGKLENRSFTFGGVNYTSHLAVCDLASWEMEGDADLRRRPPALEGDWIVRESAAREERLNAVQEILRRQLNKPALRIQKRQVVREVVVARGRLAFPPEVAAGGNKIHATASEKPGEGGWGSGPLAGLLDSIGDHIGRPVIDETESGGEQVSWTYDMSAPEAADAAAQFRRLLANVSRRTGLRLETERRAVTVYVLEDGEPAKK